MAGLGKHIRCAMAMARSNSRMLIIVLPLLGLSFLLFLLSSSPLRTTPSPSPSHFRLPNANIETSFVASLEHFLTHKAPPPNSPFLPHDDTVLGAPSQNDITNLDNALCHNDMDRLYTDPYYPVSLPLRVYVYNMPSKFTYDLLWLFRNTYRDTSNLTSNGSPLHRLIEQHSIDYWLWADLIAPQSERLLKSVVRVHRQEDADLFYIPFFTTISFFLMEKQQCKGLSRV